MSPGAIKAEKSRIGRRIRSLAKHRAALDAAVAEFGEDLDASAWEEAFSSDDPGDTNKVMAVTGGYSTLIKNYVELLKASARLTGLMPGRRPNAERCFEAIRDDGGLTKPQVELVKELYRFQGRMEHVSPDLSAEEIRDAILRLRDELPGLIEHTLAWLGRRGVL